MYRYTPIEIPSLATAQAPLPKRIEWDLLSFGDAVGTLSSVISLTETSELTAYEASFISCTHSEGKSWESLFIPLDADGVNGISLTWWNRNRGLNGQINVKHCSVSDYYNTVASKAVYKGYDVVAYVGRDRGFTRRHAFVDELASRERSSSPVIAMSRSDMVGLTSIRGWPKQLGECMAKALNSHPAITQFFRRLRKKGLLTQALREMKDLRSTPEEVVDAFCETLADLTSVEVADSPSAPVYPEPSDVKPKKAQEKADLYQSWGAFG